MVSFLPLEIQYTIPTPTPILQIFEAGQWFSGFYIGLVHIILSELLEDLQEYSVTGDKWNKPRSGCNYNHGRTLFKTARKQLVRN